VETFDAYLKNRAKSVKRQEETPRNADAAAKKVVERCESLRRHLSIRALYKSQPPKDRDLRKKVLAELRATGEELKKNAEWLETNWQQFDVVNYKKFAAAAGRQ
jgi:hypothetical protein